MSLSGWLGKGVVVLGMLFGGFVIPVAHAGLNVFGPECGLEGTEEEKIADCAQKRPQDSVSCMLVVDFSSFSIPCSSVPTYRAEGFVTRQQVLVTQTRGGVVMKTVEEPGGLMPPRGPQGDRVCYMTLPPRGKLQLFDCAHAETMKQDRIQVHIWSRQSDALWKHEPSGTYWNGPRFGTKTIFGAMRSCRGRIGKVRFALPYCGDLVRAVTSGLREIVSFEHVQKNRLWCRGPGPGAGEIFTFDLGGGGVRVADPLDGGGVLCIGN